MSRLAAVATCVLLLAACGPAPTTSDAAGEVCAGVAERFQVEVLRWYATTGRGYDTWVAQRTGVRTFSREYDDDDDPLTVCLLKGDLGEIRRRPPPPGAPTRPDPGRYERAYYFVLPDGQVRVHMK